MLGRNSVAALVLFLGCFAAVAHAQQASQCPGPVQKRHPFPPFEFVTNSDLEAANFQQFKAQIVPCVANIANLSKDPNVAKDAPVFVNWLIPGPAGSVPPGEPLPGTPLLLKDPAEALAFDKSNHRIEGCLEYGYGGNFVTAPFLATKDQLDAVMNERKLGCRLATVKHGAPSASSTLEKLEELLFKVTNFLASDSKRPRETLLKLNGTVEVHPVSGTSYQSFFRYALTKLPGSPDGNVEDLTIRPEFEGPAEVLLGEFVKRYGEHLAALREDAIILDVADIKNPVLRYARYNFYDRNNVLVGAINFPIFLRSER